ncbi:DUF4910 domain-containing protein [Halomonas sp. DN3]|uniref:DUF4910 domain-containing protein n=1 Tax=Halomonas sp. DN3 TaxID=2953657 RepID=UPI00209DCF17|nr:DUF4910 domain-containing protein [Halomonas sp. DN3]USZ48332.1 DUF4910 domain-containing protein [Halomonas sp. DN3]
MTACTQSATTASVAAGDAMMAMLADLTPLNRVICSSDYDATVVYLAERWPLREHRFEASDVHNGWVIPPRWDVLEAAIYKDGECIYDGRWHPMAVMALSLPFRGTVSREELKSHLHFDHRYEERIPFHFRQLFTSWQRDWGFCVPRRLVERLAPGDYEVVIETREAPGYLRCLDYHLPGQLEQTIVLGANLDHPGVANDGLSGVAVGLAVFEALAARPRRFSYRLVLAPGIMGTEYYLGRLPAAERALLFEGLMLEMLGSPTILNLQRSRGAGSNIEQALSRVLNEGGHDYREGAFESLLLNDEYLWEAYGIPMASLSRYPYPEYHTDADNLGLMSPQRLLEARDVVLAAIDDIESSPLIKKRFEGNVCLSHPRHDLYVDPGQVAFGDVPDESRRRMRLLMDSIPTLTRPTTVRQLAREVGLEESVVHDYLKRWRDCGLVELV